jgi:phenylalanyl-tRNA synthetase alpha chain
VHLRSIVTVSRLQESAHSKLVVTPEAQTYLDAGASPEKSVFDNIPAGGGDMNLLKDSLRNVWGVGFKKAMERRWVTVSKVDGKSIVTRTAECAEDTCLAQLQNVTSGMDLPAPAVAELKKRKLAKVDAWKTYKLMKGPAFSLERVKPATELTMDMLQSGEWKTKTFKEFNYKVCLNCCIAVFGSCVTTAKRLSILQA